MNASVGVRGLAAHAAATPHRLALAEPATGRNSTFVELHEESTRLAHAYLRLGVRTDAPVAVMLPNSIEFFVAAQAAANAGAPYVPVNWHLKADEVAYILRDSGAAVLVTTPDLVPLVRSALTEVPHCTVMTTDDLPDVLAGETTTPLAGWPVARWMYYTSGTTGRPKGVVHGGFDPKLMAAFENAIADLWDLTAADSYLLAGPAYHAGPGGYAGTTLYVGGTVVVMPQWDAAEALRLVGEHRITVSFLTPAHFIRLLDLPGSCWRRADLTSLRLIVHGGAPCPPAVKRQIIDLVPGEVAEVYGGSEGGGTRIYSQDWLAHEGSVGTAWPGSEIRILDEAGRSRPVGQDGLVYLRTPAPTRFHYHRDADRTATAWHADAFTLGDIGHLDADGYLYLTGRSADLLLWNGTNIYPREIELVLESHPAVVDCVVVGRPSEREGEIPVAVVELREPTPDDELTRHCRAGLADFKCPREFVHVDAIPRDPNGKVRRHELTRELFASTD
ncbi:acyl-CoA synthetase [Sporichthya brevicatena]|uniref:Acyl-CoA synthetase n=1 Tax=Sporichthya brevicatena TaxID=171442 RepID=A0ABN1G3P0_9ACTN